MFLCVCVSILPLSTILMFGFGIDPTVCSFLFLILSRVMKIENHDREPEILQFIHNN